MEIADITNQWSVEKWEEVEHILRIRHEGVNAYWITRDNSKYPLLSVLVKGDLAFVQFMRADRDAGFASVGKMPGKQAGVVTAFPISRNCADDLRIQDDSIVGFSEALAAVKEFFRSADLPTSIEWDQL